MSDYYVETPEVVPLAYRVAGAGSRCLAACIDTLLIGLIQLAVGLVLLVLGSFFGSNLDDLNDVLLALGAIVGFSMLWGFYLLFELRWSGQTPGKRLLGLRVIREGGRPLDFSASAIRNLVRVIDLLPFAYGLGVLSAFLDPHARRLGDLAAGTLVVRETSTVSLADLHHYSLPLYLPPPPPDHPELALPTLHLARSEDYALVEAFLRQRGKLSQARRAELGTRLAAALAARLELAAAPESERLLEQFVREYRALYR